MLTKQERTDLRASLAARLAAGASPQNVISAVFDGSAPAILQAVPTGAPPHLEIAAAVINYCLLDRWERTPSLLETLLTDLIDHGEAGLVDIRTRVQQRKDPNLGMLSATWLTGERPFFGRDLARQRVADLLNSGAKPILAVQGQTKSGKTYTGDWLDYLSQEARFDFRIVIERLESGSGPSMSPDMLAESLVAKMGRPIDTLPAPTPHRYEKRLCNWIISNALQPPGLRTWIVLDGFDDPDLDRGSAALIQELAGNVLSGELNRRVRLVLIDFASTLAQVDETRIGREGVPVPDTLQAAELKSCLQEHFADTQQSVDDGFLTALANKLLADADTQRQQPGHDQDPRLKIVNHSLYALRQEDLKRIGRIA
jgi:hypothetical protein